MTYPGNWVTKVVPNPNGRALVGAAEEAALLFDGFEVVSFHEPGFDLDVGDAGFGTPLAADWAIPSAAHHSAAIEWQDGDLGPPRPEGSGPRGFDAPPQIFTDADDSHVLPERVRAPEPHGDGTRGRAQDASPELTGAGFESASGQALPPFEEVEQNYDGVMELSQVAGADLPDFQVMDTNQDGALDSTEFYQGGAQISFEELDQNSDGMISEQELAAHGEEIVVIGTAGRSFLGIPEFYFGPGYEYDDFYDWYYGGGGGDGSGTVADTPTVTLNLTNQDNLAAAQQTKAVMEGNIAQLTTMINNLDDSDVITLADGTVASGAQIQAWWSGVDFEITDANYGANRAGVFQNFHTAARAHPFYFLRWSN